MTRAGDTVKIIGGMTRRGETVTVEQVSGAECTIIDLNGNKGLYALTDVEKCNMSEWVEIHKEEAGGYGRKTEAMQVAGGCLVRNFGWGDFSTESSVFVPDSHIVDGQVVQKPTRIQVSQTQCITADEVAAISKRPDELIFTLRCGKEIIVTEDIDLMLATFMEFSP